MKTRRLFPDRRRRQRLPAALAAVAAMGGTLIALPQPTQAWVHCAARPLHPTCCPSPCPVTDGSRLGDLVATANDAFTAVERYASMLDTYVEIWDTVGPNGALVNSVRGLQSSAEGVLREAGQLGSTIVATTQQQLQDPRQLAAAVKQVLEEPAAPTASDRMTRAASRTAAATEEAVNGLVNAAHNLTGLADIAESREDVTALATSATSLRGDYSANTAARRAVHDTMIGLNDLLSRWAAMAGSAALLDHPKGAGTASGSAAPSPLAADLAGKAEHFARLRDARRRIQVLDGIISAATSLHNDRHAANIMLAQYPGLQNTVNSHEQAIAWRDGEQATATGILSSAFIHPGQVFETARTALLAQDTTGWKDNTTKTARASQASNAVVAAILADPEAWGEIRREAWTTDDTGRIVPRVMNDDGFALAGCAFPCQPEVLVQSFETWLENDKLERFWHPLRIDADIAIERLDRRFAEIEQRRGYDITSSFAAAEEARLVQEFKSGLNALATVRAEGFTTEQVRIVDTFAGVMDDAAERILADGGAMTLVMVEWPQ